LLICPADDSRQKVSKWKSVSSNSNVSYFVNVDAGPFPSAPVGILTGDRCITGGVMSASLMLLDSNSPAGWAYNIHTPSGLARKSHQNGGVIGLSDGRVQEATSAQLRHIIQASTNEIIRLAIP
jgi:hypothetical protein